MPPIKTLDANEQRVNETSPINPHQLAHGQGSEKGLVRLGAGPGQDGEGVSVAPDKWSGSVSLSSFFFCFFLLFTHTFYVMPLCMCFDHQSNQ